MAGSGYTDYQRKIDHLGEAVDSNANLISAINELIDANTNLTTSITSVNEKYIERNYTTVEPAGSVGLVGAASGSSVFYTVPGGTTFYLSGYNMSADSISTNVNQSPYTTTLLDQDSSGAYVTLQQLTASGSSFSPAGQVMGGASNVTINLKPAHEFTTGTNFRLQAWKNVAAASVTANVYCTLFGWTE